MAAKETDLLTCLLLGQKARGLQSVFYLFYFFFGGVRREEEILKSVSNVLLSSLSRSVLKLKKALSVCFLTKFALNRMSKSIKQSLLLLSLVPAFYWILRLF